MGNNLTNALRKAKIKKAKKEDRAKRMVAAIKLAQAKKKSIS